MEMGSVLSLAIQMGTALDSRLEMVLGLVLELEPELVLSSHSRQEPEHLPVKSLVVPE